MPVFHGMPVFHFLALLVIIQLLLDFRLLLQQHPGQLCGSLGMGFLEPAGRLIGVHLLTGIRGIDEDHVVGIVGEGIYQRQVAAQLLIALLQGPADLIHSLDIIHQDLILQL